MVMMSRSDVYVLSETGTRLPSNCVLLLQICCTSLVYLSRLLQVLSPRQASALLCLAVALVHNQLIERAEKAFSF